MNLEELQRQLVDLKKMKGNAEGHTMNQVDAAIASVESQIAAMTPVEDAPVEEPPKEDA